MKTTLVVLSLAALPVMVTAGFSGEPSGPPPSREGESPFPDCPGTPNCVSSLAADPARRVPPFPVKGTPDRSMELLAGIVRALSRTRVTALSGQELRAQARSILGFVDDIVFRLDAARGVIHVRSAARTGYWDLGVNRRRVERIRRQYLRSY